MNEKFFINFKNRAENQTGRTLRVLRTGNGEFCNIELRSYLKKCGIQHQTTAPYTPEQNGLAERMNRTIVEKIRCMLVDSNLDKQHWAEAASTAAYIVNRLPCSRIPISSAIATPIGPMIAMIADQWRDTHFFSMVLRYLGMPGDNPQSHYQPLRRSICRFRLPHRKRFG